jgi:ABC-type branched-subunit amino acid transport system substrate-binding protein
MASGVLKNLGFGLAALLAGAMPAMAQDKCKGEIVFGTTMSLTGPFSTLADSWKRLTEVFQEEYNKDGGVELKACKKKVPIKFVIYDDQSVAATAVALYERMATVDKVDLFVGPDWSSHGFPVSQVFEKHKIPSVMSNVATPNVYERGFKYIAGVALHAGTWSKNYFEMLQTVTPKPQSIFWVVHDNLVTKTIHNIHKSVAEKAGLKTVGEDIFAGTTKDFTGVVLKIRAAKPDVIYISSFDNVSVPLMQQMRQLQVKAMDVHHIMANGAMARQANLEGVTGEIYWHEGIKGPYSDLANRVLTRANVKIFDYLWTGGRIDSYLMMLQAIERVGELDRDKIAEELRKPGAVWKRPGGEFKLGAGGLSEIVAFTHQMQNGQPVVVWPKAQATGQLKWPSPSWQ